MAFPFKTGGDFYNCEAQRMRLHNLGANPTETATGLMYFNTGASNLGKHAVVHDGTNFKALAFVDEIATNADFVELKEKVDLLIGDDVDTDTIIDSWKEVQAFLANIEDTKTLQGMLSSYLPKSGGTLTAYDAPLTLASTSARVFQVFMVGTSNKGSVGYANGLTFISNDAGNYARIGVNDNGIPQYWSDNNASTAQTLLHSGNIGDYALKTDGSNVMTGHIRTKGYLEFLNTDGTSLGVYNVNAYNNTPIYLLNGGWKTLAFTDSNVASATKLADNTAFTAWGQTFFENGKPKSLAGTMYFAQNQAALAVPLASGESAKIFLQVNPSGNLLIGQQTAQSNSNTRIFGNNIDFCYGTAGSISATAMTINSSGNVTIGKSDTASTSYKLQVDGPSRFTDRVSVTSLRIMPANGSNAADFAIDGSSLTLNRELKFTNIAASDISSGIACAFKTSLAQIENLIASSIILGASSGSASNLGFSIKKYTSIANTAPAGLETLLTVNTSGNVLIGTPNELKSGAKLQVKGDLYVEGNIIATKEVSAGGAGQEGESGSGGAEVISQQLASGQSTYTITNTIKRSDIAVSLYEWNANNGSWDMCLADISVKDATITVTFGSATSVNHKLVAVG